MSDESDENAGGGRQFRPSPHVYQREPATFGALPVLMR